MVEMQRRSFIQLMACLGIISKVGNVAAVGQENKKTGLIYNDLFLQHQLENDHPESPGRLVSIIDALKQAGIVNALSHIPFSTQAYPEALSLVHSRKHLQGLRTHHSNHVAMAVVTGILAAVDEVCNGRLDNVFCATRPPGHHAANSGQVEGFCFYNGVAIAARYAQQMYDLQNILIVDWDYHHGNATEAFFYADPSVLFFSTHDYYAYPGTGDPARKGEGKGLGFTINVHLDCGAGDAEIIAAFKDKLLPAANAFKPDLILISAGFDSRQDDLLGCFRVSDQGYVELTQMIMQLAKKHCDGRIVSVLEGGYYLPGLASAVTNHVQTLMKY